MIYTLTLNPALDYVVEVADFTEGSINRTKNELKYPGGKGINVSRVLKRLGVSSTALGFTGGFTGDYIENVLEQENIETDFVKVNGDTRINVKIRGGKETEVNGASPSIYEDDIRSLESRLALLDNEDQLVVAGSLPSMLPTDTYKRLMIRLNEKGIRVYLDTSGEALTKALEASPYFVKPNHLELAELYGVSISSVEEAVQYGKKLLDDFDISHAVISMAGEGAVYLHGDEAYQAKPPERPAVNSVGAGDSLVAGFIAKHLLSNHPDEVLAFAVSAGSATAFSETFCTKEEVEQMNKEIKTAVLYE
ncbi:1-phosphofructokinase [Alteribacillus sp. YIM 98480]|uniref:1-phosphofructokinase n=1 Tax=Alteribacillus sp. YIM 98480 TaxID=2606599 RepID=UPI00131BC92C|nr:1-phosphofructokinase [Alteribacillus sp. YIM 98480]